MKYPANHKPAIKHLRSVDPVLAGWIDRLGPCTLGQQPCTDSLMAVLIRSIVYQRISIAAANTVHKRFLALYPAGFPTAEQVLETPVEELRAIGLPAAKVAYIKDVAANVLAGLPTMLELSVLPNEEIIDRLTQINGIGRWSVEMILMFQLQRWDILPVADLGLQLAVRDCYGRSAKPKAKDLETLAEKWRPHRSIATWYLWRSRDEQNQQLLDAWS
jgi:DNA-3-methyladenine glycosylase II